MQEVLRMMIKLIQMGQKQRANQYKQDSAACLPQTAWSKEDADKAFFKESKEASHSLA